MKFCFDIVCTKSNNNVVAVKVNIDDSPKAEFKEHGAVTELMAVKTVKETEYLVAEAEAWLRVF